MNTAWQVFDDTAAAAQACSVSITGFIQEAITERGLATLAISGGSSPKPLFERLAASHLPWNLIHLFWVDERCVPPGDAASNYRMANELLIRPAHIPPGRVHRIQGELPPPKAAELYIAEIAVLFGLSNGAFPRFDVVHRGIGPDAHTASLFPGLPLIDDRENIAAAVFAPQFNQWRVTLLPGTLLAARHTVVLAAGEDKAEAVKGTLKGDYDPKKYPAQIGVREGSGAICFLDRAAARFIE